MKKPEHLHRGDRLGPSFSPPEEDLFQLNLIVAEERGSRLTLRSATDIHKESMAIDKYCPIDCC